MIHLFSNSLGREELDAVAGVFSSQWVGKGKQCDAFETEFARSLATPRVLLTNSATSAIQIAIRVLGIGPGDEVIVTTVTFVACATAVLEAGAVPVFADVDRQTLNIDPAEIERLKTPRTKAVFVLHYGGHPCPMDDIRAACGDDIAIIEDSANAVCSLYKGEMCGTLGEAGIFSFDAMKILVMTDGGALVLKEEEAFMRAKTYRYLGLAAGSKSGIESMANTPERWWEYDLDAHSGRHISNDVLAAIGRVQLRKLPDFIARRTVIWDAYQSELADVPEVTRPPEPLPDTTSSYYLYWIQLADQRDRLAAYLSEHGVYSTFRYYPLHLVKYLAGHHAYLPVATQVSETTLNLPLHQNLTDDEVQKIIDLIRRFVKRRPRR